MAHKVKDNSFKLILHEPELFVEFLRDFVPIKILEDIAPSDVEDITERFLPLFDENKDSDTIKRINLKNQNTLFVIAIVEHESEVNYRASFKMLQYITLVLADYEKEANKNARLAKNIKYDISLLKNFKYPPVLPIVFYDGGGEWTAETNFFNKTEMNEVFSKYIPKFEYELVRLKNYSQEALVRFGDTLSLVMLLDKLQSFDGQRLLSKLPENYIELLKLNIPEHLLELLSNVVTVLMRRINVPDEEISTVTERIYKRRFQEMFAMLEDYDVQATRREAKEEGKLEGREEGKIEGREEGKEESKIEDVINIIKKWHVTLTNAMDALELDLERRDQVINELRKQNIAFVE